MSGPVAQYGDQEFTGAEQAVADINAKGGIKGNKLQIVKYDDACDPKQAVAVANKVVNDGIKYVIGHLCSSSTQPASDIYEDEGILMITPAATAPELTARGYQLILRTTGPDIAPTTATLISSARAILLNASAIHPASNALPFMFILRIPTLLVITCVVMLLCSTLFRFIRSYPCFSSILC